MITLQPPPVEARVCLKSHPHLKGYVKEVSSWITIVSIPRSELGECVSQDVRVHEVTVEWDDPEKVTEQHAPTCHGISPVMSNHLKVINSMTPKQTLEALRQMVRRRKKIMGNEAFLQNEVLMEVDNILKGRLIF